MCSGAQWINADSIPTVFALEMTVGLLTVTESSRFIRYFGAPAYRWLPNSTVGRTYYYIIYEIKATTF